MVTQLMYSEITLCFVNTSTANIFEGDSDL